MTVKAIHQFSIACYPGDGISNGMFLTQRLLHQAGIASEIYCVDIDPQLKDRVHPFTDYQGDAEQVLLIHHGIGNNQEETLKQLPDQRFMVFHNITPGSFFAADDPIQAMLTHGWQQVDSWKSWLSGAIGDSRQNYDLLLQHGYDADKCDDIALLVDLEKFNQLKPENSCRPLDEVFQLLFVGRLMPHKNQHGLIETLYHLRCMTQQDVRLTLVGNDSDQHYVDQLRQQIQEFGLDQAVTITGKVSTEALTRYYQQADLYLSLSHHEGFGMPLIEAMTQQLPVLAYSSPDSNVANTVGKGGAILQSDDPKQCAATISQLMANPRLRAALNQAAQQHLTSYQPQALYSKLQRFMARFDIELPHCDFAAANQQSVSYRIEGPFDSSYSLALVNRKLAQALNSKQTGQVGLYSTEGHGDYPANQDFLAANPEMAAMQTIGTAQAESDTCLRLLYPPRVTGMKGKQNGLGCYGWEESVLPEEYVTNFNQHLQFSTTMSDYVTRTMVDNGVTIPLYTSGIGVDHILEAEPDSSALPSITQSFKLLHISSCFPRKGVDCLLAAYGQAFDGNDDVSLILKTFPNPHHDIEQQLAEWRAALDNPPHITLINADLTDNAIRALYQQADVLVAPSRGEGFGLPMAEAMLHQLPVITTGFGGQTDFCTTDTSWLIDYQFDRAQSHMGQAASVWVEPSVEHLTELLSTFWQQYQQNNLGTFCAEKLAKAEQLIRSDFSWQAVAKRTEQAIKDLESKPLLEPALKFGSVTTWNSKCGIATYSQMLLEPALASATIFANDDAELTATDDAWVQRCWSAGQDDDLSRLEQAIMSAGINQLLIQFNFSFFNLDALKQLLSNLHDKGVQTFLTLHSSADVYWGEELKTIRTLLPELHDCTRLFVHSAQDLNRLKSFGLVENCTLLPHGVQRHQMEKLKPEQTPEQLTGKQVIASYGFILPHKGIKQLIEAFKLLHQQQPDSHLLLVTAEYPAPISHQEVVECSALISALQLDAHVTLITDFLEHEQSLAWMSMADCIVFPYQDTQESASGAVRWGLATEKPVFCTPLGIFEDVADAVNFLPGTSAEQIATGLQTALADKEQLTELKQRQLEWLNQHDWNKVSRRLRNLCISVQLNGSTS